MKDLTYFKAMPFLVVLAVLTPMISGCGSGSSGSAAAAIMSKKISGTVATGAAIADAKVTVKGSNGNTVVVTTNQNGEYTADTTNLVAPFMVKAEGKDPNDDTKTLQYFSMVEKVSSTNVINVTPLTMALAKSATQTDLAGLFDRPENFLSTIDAEKLKNAQDVIKKQLENYARTANGGVDTEIPDFTSEQFQTSMQSVMDKMLELIAVDSTGKIKDKFNNGDIFDPSGFDPQKSIDKQMLAKAPTPPDSMIKALAAQSGIKNTIDELSKAYSGSNRADLVAALDNAYNSTATPAFFLQGRTASEDKAKTLSDYDKGARVSLHLIGLGGKNVSKISEDRATIVWGLVRLSAKQFDTQPEQKAIMEFQFIKVGNEWKLNGNQEQTAATSPGQVSVKAVKALGNPRATPATADTVATSVSTDYMLCIGKGPTALAKGAQTLPASDQLTASSEKDLVCSATGASSAMFNLSAWKPTTAPIRLYVYFIHQSDGNVLNLSTGGDILDITGTVFPSTGSELHICAGTVTLAPDNSGLVCTPAPGVE